MGGGRRNCVLLVIIAAAMLVAGCAATPKGGNPSFALTVEEARADLARMAKDPRPLRRPVVILGGFADPGIGGLAVGTEIRKYLRDPQVVCVSFFFCDSFDGCRQKVIEAVDRAFPTDDPNQTVEVDVIGLSMGGLVGRYCAADFTAAEHRTSNIEHRMLSASTTTTTTTTTTMMTSGNHRRLRVHALFTCSSPHQGAVRAGAFPLLLRMQGDMIGGSDFLRQLEEAERCGGVGYELAPYVRLGDEVVGPPNAAPRGRVAWWVPNQPGQVAHIGAMTDPRILADVVRRLRGETPWTSEPPAPLPE